MDLWEKRGRRETERGQREREREVGVEGREHDQFINWPPCSSYKFWNFASSNRQFQWLAFMPQYMSAPILPVMPTSIKIPIFQEFITDPKMLS